MLFDGECVIIPLEMFYIAERRSSVKLIVCLSDDGGMMFNHRRQSRDRVLIADMIDQTQGAPLWVSPYSAPLFGEDCPHLRVDALPVNAAKVGDYCFVEDTSLPQNLDAVEELILYRWNRLYPSDVYFTLDTSAFSPQETTEFVGSSHEKITKEILKK